MSLLHSLPDYEIEEKSFDRLEFLAADRVRGLNDSKKKLLDKYINAGKKVDEIILESGNPEDVILRLANAGEFDLLVSASHGITGLKELLLGTTTQHLVNDSTIPVISFPNEFKQIKSRKVVFAGEFDIDDYPDLSVVRYFDRNYELHLLKIVNENISNIDSELDKVKKYCREYDINPEAIHIEQSRAVDEGLHQFILEHDIALCIMATHARHGISHFFLGSIAEDMLDRIDIPLITFRIG